LAGYSIADASFLPVLRFLYIRRVFIGREAQAGRRLDALDTSRQLWRGTLGYLLLMMLNDFIEKLASSIDDQGFCKWSTVSADGRH
jgi:hypothetical protein